ncbi:MAG: hypothetical protein AAGG46_12845, partial [Planctomycetota bacterium]
GGGGLMLVLGEQVNRRYYNRQFFDESDEPVLPIGLDLPTQTAVDATGAPPKLATVDHPALRVFTGERASFLDLIRVRQRHTLRTPPNDAAASGVKTLASLANDAPIMLESRGGAGRVICLLTTAARPASRTEGWSNLSVSPLFPVLVNELTAYVAAPKLQPVQRPIGAAWRSVVSELAPAATTLERLGEQGFERVTSGEDLDAWGAAESAGVYRLQASSGSATPLATNVDPAEGNLELLSRQELRSAFGDLDLQITTADRIAGTTDASSVQLYQRVGLLLLVVLAVEQGIAYWCSYHRAAGASGSAA